MTKLILGRTDLQTVRPDVALEADGWDPTKFSSGSNKKLPWVCQKGHKWVAQICDRTRSESTGCPYCANKKVLAGFNDLQTRFPDIANDADGWDPQAVMPGSSRIYSWRCDFGHVWNVSVNSRTNNDSGCPYCSNKKVWKGFNDLNTKFPELARQANGWNPSDVLYSTKKKFDWICPLNHLFSASVNSRTGKDKTGCPYCTNRKVLTGFNDLETLFSTIAAEANGWDPSKILPGSKQKLLWRCSLGHDFFATPSSRTSTRNSGCPYCDGKQVWLGFNDLRTCFPSVAEEADGWDTEKVVSKSTRILPWICPEGHRWNAAVYNRTSNSTGCPVCAERGFNPDKEAWFYLMARDGEQQIGITNYLDKRMRYHATKGWKMVEVVGPFAGNLVLDAERQIKRWLWTEIGVIAGTRENWETRKLKVKSLAELRKISEIHTPCF